MSSKNYKSTLYAVFVGAMIIIAILGVYLQISGKIAPLYR